MCYPVLCTVCGKQKWGGCGMHLAGLMKKYSYEERCHCPGTRWLDGDQPTDSCEPGSTPASNKPTTFDFDLIVIGGGSGGIACAKEAAAQNVKVRLYDHVEDRGKGTKWGLGGTCVNVGCIPKKLFHAAAMQGQMMKESMPSFGWAQAPEEKGFVHQWDTLIKNVSDHIGSLNFGYRVNLRKLGIDVVNDRAEFVDQWRIKSMNAEGVCTIVSAKYIVVATGGRPSLPTIEGKELAISSDELFSLPQRPSSCLVVGASYVALECAGLLAGLGVDTSVMVRSILLRGFDTQMAALVGESLEEEGVKFIHESLPTKIVKNEKGFLDVTYDAPGKVSITKTFESVLYAIGRSYADINYKAAGVKTNERSGRVIVDHQDRSSAENIFAVGDVADGRPELTPVAIKSGKLLATRLFGKGSQLMRYDLVPTSVFTPIEYGSIGLSEEAALERYGDSSVNVYHANFTPLEWALPHKTGAYVKLICHSGSNDRVVGLHYFGPNAGEVVQGYAVAMTMGATKEQFDRTLGIHPTCSEEFTTLNTTKKEKKNFVKSGC